LTFQVTKRTLVRSLALLAVVAAACSVAFLAGQSTRLTEATATERVTTTVKATSARLTAEHTDELKRAAKAAHRHEQTRVRRTNQMWRGRVSKMNREHKREVEEAAATGYSSGSAAGYSSGNAAGVEEGVEKASDELVCSDDSDVDLPACFF